MKFNKVLKEAQQGASTDMYIFTRANNKFASKDYGKFDPKQYNTLPNTNDVKEYKKKRCKSKKDKALAYLTKINLGYKIKI